jgi:hypothetical protein
LSITLASAIGLAGKETMAGCYEQANKPAGTDHRRAEGKLNNETGVRRAMVRQFIAAQPSKMAEGKPSVTSVYLN